MDRDTLIGKVIGNYHIVDVVAKGGFGIVYRAEHTFPQFKDRVVAIKILHAYQNSPEKRAGFLQEAKMLQNLKHPYILPFIDIGLYENKLYLMTEYAANGSLQGRVPRSLNLLPIEEVYIILSQVGQAL